VNDQGSRTHIDASAAMIAAARDHLDWLRRELAFTDDVVVSSRRCIAESDEALRLAARIQAEWTPARPSSFSNGPSINARRELSLN
jgi:hypothetical protein